LGPISGEIRGFSGEIRGIWGNSGLLSVANSFIVMDMEVSTGGRGRGMLLEVNRLKIEKLTVIFGAYSVETVDSGQWRVDRGELVVERPPET
jgi:hypothetical protein